MRKGATHDSPRNRSTLGALALGSLNSSQLSSTDILSNEYLFPAITNVANPKRLGNSPLCMTPIAFRASRTLIVS